MSIYENSSKLVAFKTYDYRPNIIIKLVLYRYESNGRYLVSIRTLNLLGAKYGGIVLLKGNTLADILTQQRNLPSHVKPMLAEFIKGQM